MWKKLVQLYENESLEIRAKVPFVFIGCLATMGTYLSVLALYSVIHMDKVFNAPPFVLPLIVLIGLLAIAVSVVCLYKKKLRLSVNFFLLHLLFIIASGISLIDAVDSSIFFFIAMSIIVSSVLALMLVDNRGELFFHLALDVLLLAFLDVFKLIQGSVSYTAGYIVMFIFSIMDFLLIMLLLIRFKSTFRNMLSDINNIINQSKLSIVNLNTASKEIEAAAQEQTSASNEHASGITEISATIEELSVTAKQITKNVGELVYSSEEVIKLLKESGDQLLVTAGQLDEIGTISSTNARGISDLGKRSAVINDMVEIIKEVANKTNILSINASIEASRSGDAGAGFSVVAAEIRELSKETIASAKNAEKAAIDIQDFLNSIIIATENEALKVNDSGMIVNKINKNIVEIVGKINNNYSFTQKIDISIKQQEVGSKQVATTMQQLAEISRQSAETARQTLSAVKDIVKLSQDLDVLVNKKQ